MTDHPTLVRMFVLDSICDDYEDRAKILRDVSDCAAASRCTVTPEQVDQAIATLVNDGLAKAYKLSGNGDPLELPGMPPAHPVLEWYEGYYFWITPAGREVYVAFSDWPSNDDGELRKV